MPHPLSTEWQSRASTPTPPWGPRPTSASTLAFGAVSVGPPNVGAALRSGRRGHCTTSATSTTPRASSCPGMLPRTPGTCHPTSGSHCAEPPSSMSEWGGQGHLQNQRTGLCPRSPGASRATATGPGPEHPCPPHHLSTKPAWCWPVDSPSPPPHWPRPQGLRGVHQASCRFPVRQSPTQCREAGKAPSRSHGWRLESTWLEGGQGHRPSLVGGRTLPLKTRVGQASPGCRPWSSWYLLAVAPELGGPP